MRFLERAELLEALRMRLEMADGLEIAVAWATPSPALEMILQFAKRAKKKPRVVVGISGAGTHPLALRKLAKACELKVCIGSQGVFHPKYYRFIYKNEAVFWCGSANLSIRGFGMNDEVVVEATDNGGGGEWFKRLWDGLPDDTSGLMANYIENWAPPPDVERQQKCPARKEHPIHLLENGGPRNWRSYLAALRECDAYWLSRGWGFTVLGERQSYLHTISVGHEVVQLEDWSTLTRTEIQALLGLSDPGETNSYGLLGSMKGAAKAVSKFTNNSNIDLVTRSDIRDSIHSVSTAQPKQFSSQAAEAVERISSHERFNSGVATRLLTLMRPDCAVSVNKGSRAGLAELSGLSPSTLGKPANYLRLLEWVQQQAWYRVPEPKDPGEKLIWSMRAALIDAFVYRPS